MRGAAAAALALLAAPALAGSGVEGDVATSGRDLPPAPWPAAVDPGAGEAVFDRCAGATYVWLQVRPEGVREDEARFAHESFVIALLTREYEAGGPSDGAIEARAEDLLGRAVQRYLASFKAPAYGGSPEAMLAADLDACTTVLEGVAESAVAE